MPLFHTRFLVCVCVCFFLGGGGREMNPVGEKKVLIDLSRDLRRCFPRKYIRFTICASYFDQKENCLECRPAWQAEHSMQTNYDIPPRIFFGGGGGPSVPLYTSMIPWVEKFEYSVYLIDTHTFAPSPQVVTRVSMCTNRCVCLTLTPPTIIWRRGARTYGSCVILASPIATRSARTTSCLGISSTGSSKK